jgi:uncharacterized protein
MRILTPVVARRLAVSRQRLAGARPPASPEGILALVRELGCLQLDPISAVDRSHRLVLFSRIGGFDPAHLEKLLWHERRLFEYWAHAASIVPAEDWPIHGDMMRRYADGSSAWVQSVRAWMRENEALRQRVFDEIARHGPLPGRHFQGEHTSGWETTGWNSGRSTARMLEFLWLQGRLLVAGRSGRQQERLWDLAERCLPEHVPREVLAEPELQSRAVQRSLRALGVARPQHVKQHFIRNRYRGLPGVLEGLERQGLIERVEIRGEDGAWPGPWYVHAEDVPLLEALEAGEWQPRTTLLSPFDNLLCDRKRTEQLFGFDFRLEIYVPKAKRKYGYYVLPILHGDRLIGRVDPLFDRKSGRLLVHAVHAEPGAPRDAATQKAVRGAIEALADFVGAASIELAKVPALWRRALR